MRTVSTDELERVIVAPGPIPVVAGVVEPRLPPPPPPPPTSLDVDDDEEDEELLDEATCPTLYSPAPYGPAP
ncbi:MAG: hypothetical protein KF777_24340 [Planctomycetaceae bacterium]|nr:hypothetical protein [Planctomycetaceae bacterium]